MLELFPENYVWNLSVNIALCSGANIGEVNVICRQLQNASQQDDEGSTEAFFNAWCSQADRLVMLAKTDMASGRRLSAAAKYGRASTCYLTAERMQHRSFEPRAGAYRKMLDSFHHHVDLGGENCERIAMPFRDKKIVGLFVKGNTRGQGPAPCIVLCNGLDSTKEMIYGSGIQQALAARGISSIAVDQPGSGEALRLHGMTAMVESEIWAGAVVDYLETRIDIQPHAIGVCGWSLGGYFAPRAAAMESRFKLCVAWGANYDWGEVQRKRLQREGDRPVPHYWDHVQWVWGTTSIDTFMSLAERVTLQPVIDRIRVPFLVVHGEKDRQISPTYAEIQYREARNSPKREMRIFTDIEGGVEHCSVDNMTVVRDYISDWIAGTFLELGATGVRI